MERPLVRRVSVAILENKKVTQVSTVNKVLGLTGTDERHFVVVRQNNIEFKGILLLFFDSKNWDY